MNNSLDPIENDFQTAPPIHHAESPPASREAATTTSHILPFHGLLARMWHGSQDTHNREGGHDALDSLHIFGLPDLPIISIDESTSLDDPTLGAVNEPLVTVIGPPEVVTSASSSTIASYGKGQPWYHATVLSRSTPSKLEPTSSSTSSTTSTAGTMNTPLLTPSTGAAVAGNLDPNPLSTPSTPVPSTGPEPASITTDSSAAPSSQDPTSPGLPGSIIAAIILPVLAILGLCACLGLWFRRRSNNKKRARELEKRAEWLDPAYVARVRQEMMGLDPSKTSRTDDGEYDTRGNVNELGTVIRTTDEDSGWTNRGKMSDSLGGQPHNIRPPARTRTTDKGSPVQLSASRDPAQDSDWDFPLTHNPSESEWFSNNTLPLTPKSSRDSTRVEEPGITALPAPYFDPRGSMRESQIGLALPLPRSLSASRNPDGKLTGDGYEAFWRTDRSRSRRSTPGPQQGLGLGVNGDVRMPLQGSDDPEAEESFVSGFSSETTHVGADGSGKKVAYPTPQNSSSETICCAHSAPVEAGNVTSTMNLPKSKGEGHRLQRGAEEANAGEPAGVGNEDVVRGMLKKRLGLVDGFFGR